MNAWQMCVSNAGYFAFMLATYYRAWLHFCCYCNRYYVQKVGVYYYSLI